MREGVGLHGEMYSGIGCQSVIGLDLSFDDALKGLGGILVLLKSDFESLFVEHVSPVTSGA